MLNILAVSDNQRKLSSAIYMKKKKHLKLQKTLVEQLMAEKVKRVIGKAQHGCRC